MSSIMCTNLHQSYTLHNKRNKGRNLECSQQLNVVEEQTKAKLHDQVLQSRLKYIHIAMILPPLEKLVSGL